MRPALLILQSLVSAVVLTWPAVLHPWTNALGSPKGDAVKHVWNLWWMRRELLDGPWGLHTTLVNYPNGMELYPIEITNGVLAAWLPLPPVLASNLLALLHVTLIGVCTGWLGFRVSRTARGGHVAAALGQGSAFTAFTMHAGVGELRQAWWIPLGLALAVRARESLHPRAFAWLGLCMATATLACFYHGFFLATSVAIYAVLTFRPRRDLVVGWGVGAAVCLALVVPLVRLFSANYESGSTETELGLVEWMMRGPAQDSFPVTSLQPEELFRFDGTFGTSYTDRFEAYLGGRYLGVGSVVLAGLGLAAARRPAWPWVGIAVVGIVLAFGNALWWGGAVIEPRVALPLAWINQALAWGAEPLNFPVRYLAITGTAVAVLGALASRWRVTPWLVPLVLLEIAWGDPVPFPRSTFTLEGRDDLDAPEGGVLELTWASRTDALNASQSPVTLFDAPIRSRSVAAQIYLDRPFQSIGIERVDHWAHDGIDWSAALPLSRAMAGTQISASARRGSAALMWERGFRSVWVSHPCTGERDLRADQFLTEALGPPVQGRCGDLWTIPDPGSAQAADVAEARDVLAQALDRVVPPRLGAPEVQGKEPPPEAGPPQAVPPPPGVDPPKPDRAPAPR